MDIRSFRDGEGDRLRTFWLACGIQLRPGDDDRSLAAFALRSEGLFLVAEEHAHLVGSILAGFDGRRGWLYHVATHPDERRRGIGRTLVARVEERLAALGCPKVNLLVLDENPYAMRFWEALGYRRERTVEYGKPL
ncbi:MAG: GNAT family acetyltransferase [Chloroflexi bacterium]|nr:GNAT family acetyltransferase [Chloroflexota bacterium]